MSEGEAMSEEHSAGAPHDRDLPPVEPEGVELGRHVGGTATPPAAAAPAHRAARLRLAVLWLALLLALVIAGIALSPFWAPAVASLLPWGAEGSAPTANYARRSMRG